MTATKPRATTRKITLHITEEHARQGDRTRFNDPVSIALKERLASNVIPFVYWNWCDEVPEVPMDANEPAMLFLFIDDPDAAGPDPDQKWCRRIPLPRAASQLLWRWHRHGIDKFRPLEIRLTLPQDVLAPEAAAAG